MTFSGFMNYDETSKTACVGRRRTFNTPGEARSYERGWQDHRAGAPAIEPYDAYLKGWGDREAEACDKLDTSWDQEAA
jgi:hypothetical protein